MNLVFKEVPYKQFIALQYLTLFNHDEPNICFGKLVVENEGWKFSWHSSIINLNGIAVLTHIA